MTYSQALPTAYPVQATSNNSDSSAAHSSFSEGFSPALVHPSHDAPPQDNPSLQPSPLESAGEMPVALPLSTSVEQAVRRYFSALEGETSSDLYDLILSQVEKPLLLVALEHSQGNQSKCASILGLNRGTLRKKLKAYNLID